MHNKFNHGILGGTFDQFHIGHQELIDTAFEQSEHVTIGITQPEMYKSKLFADQIQSFQIRKDVVISYLKTKGYIDRAKLISINDIYGDSLKNNMDAIFATYANLSNVRIINKKRKTLGLKPLKVILVSTLRGNDGQIITSRRIRLGAIDKEGNSYFKIFSKKKKLTLPPDLREQMRHPLGEIVPNIDADKLLDFLQNKFVIAVGDIVALSLLKKNQQAAVCIIDQKTRRHILTKEEISSLPKAKDIQKVNNHPGTIQTSAVEGIQRMIRLFVRTGQQQVLMVRGEEDLLALPGILLAPLGSIVIYGQVDLGVVVNEVTEEKKRQIMMLISKFH